MLGLYLDGFELWPDFNWVTVEYSVVYPPV